MPDHAPTLGKVESSRGLERVLDEHAEIRDVVAQIDASSDLGILSGLLQRLRDLLQGHFAQEEADPELLALLGSGAEAIGGDPDRLASEHRELLNVLGELVVRVEAGEPGSAPSLGQQVAAFLRRLGEHDVRETRLLGRIVGADTSALPAARLGSQALEVNLRRTAVEVVIPCEHAVLLEITAPRRGVHESTRKLLREINHRYAGWDETLEELHRRAMSDLSYYLADERAPEAIAVFLSLYARVTEHAAPPVRESAVRRWLYYLEKIVAESGDALPGLLPVAKQSLSRLDAIFERAPRLAAVASPRLRHLASKLVAAAPTADVLERALDLLASALRHVYDRWLDEPDPLEWWREIAGSAHEAPTHERLLAASHTKLRECVEQLERSAARESSAERTAALLRLPDDADIERAYLDAIESVESESNESWQNQIARIHWLIRILSSEALSAVHARAISEIHHAFCDALIGADRENLERLVRETFAGLRRSRLAMSEAAFALISKLGEVVLAGGDPETARVVIDELLDWNFPSPGFSGFTDEWQVRVDPRHIRAIRAFLTVVRQNPELARPLIAALVVHLKRGGVFIADTDLFQKDVSELLNSEIEPAYHEIKQLLRIFPIYFNDVGAEGELRDVSSRIDEIGARKDPLCHFLRKQCHVESNPRLLGLVDAIGGFWTTGDRSGLEPYLPPAVLERVAAEADQHRELQRVFSAFAAGESVRELAALGLPELERRVTGLGAPRRPKAARRAAALGELSSESSEAAGPIHALSGSGVSELAEARSLEAEKAVLLVRLRQLLSQKYEFGHDDLLVRLVDSRRFGDEEVAALSAALSERRDEQALALLIGMLEELKQVVLSRKRTEGVETIYRKRHIAAGIPSMYGQYREEKFEAMGLCFRIESLANMLFDRILSCEDPDYVSRDGLRRTQQSLGLLLRAVRADGCRARGLAAGLAMFEEALVVERVSVDQYINIFQIISRSLEQLIRIRFIDVYQDVLERILRRTLAVGADPASPEVDEAILKASEVLLRDMIAQSFGLQALDRLVAKTLRKLVRAREIFEPAMLRLLVSFDAERYCVPIDAAETPLVGAVLLGNKGYQIMRLARNGLPVPPGFVLTTELCRCWPAIRSCDGLRSELRARIGAQLKRLEQLSGLRFGSPRRPLLLSVRSGSTISMPGVLDTFLNVGISEKIAAGLASHSGSPWGAWDAYRRFLQFWGMGHDIERTRFDALMRRIKTEIGVDKKSQIPPGAMREVALRYRRFVEEQGVEICEDPAEQLERCVGLVLRSWDAEKARVYRAEMKIADEWGTAVVVQSMVYGNLNERSGTGVALTCDPRRHSADVRLYGDFIVQGQGDDVVAGLVETWPISEDQRRSEGSPLACSLEADFPRIYRALLEHARVLIRDHGMFHQELEFTFESDDPEDLYVLQNRDCVMAAVRSVSAFVPSDTLEQSRLAIGIGASGSALSGRLAHSAEDIEALRRRYPDDAIILVRPDTVPDDIPLILQADGMLTSLGGATSHAALVAQQLGKTCVVGCRKLQVDKDRGRSRLGDRTLSTGDLISISGIDGSVYLGNHPCTEVRAHQLL